MSVKPAQEQGAGFPVRQLDAGLALGAVVPDGPLAEEPVLDHVDGLVAAALLAGLAAVGRVNHPDCPLKRLNQHAQQMPQGSPESVELTQLQLMVSVNPPTS